MQNAHFMVAILKIQNGGLKCANANINFWIYYALVIPKMYRFANLQKFWTKIHSEPDYPVMWLKTIGGFVNARVGSMPGYWSCMVDNDISQ